MEKFLNFAARKNIAAITKYTEIYIPENSSWEMDDMGQVYFQWGGDQWIFPKDDLIQQAEPLMEMNVKSGEKRIAFLIDHYFIGNNSGVFTFVKHFSEMCRSLGYQLDLITEISPADRIPKTFDSSNVSLFFMPEYAENNNEYMYYSSAFEEEVRGETFSLSFNGYIDQFKPELVVAHSYASTVALQKAVPNLQKRAIPFGTYTHIGDIMDANNADMIDFQDEVVRNYIELLKETDIPIMTQTPGVRQRLIDVLGREDISVLPEPFYEPKKIYTTNSGTDGVLMIGSNYKRKNFQLMFDLLAITGFPVTVICGDDMNSDGESLEEMALRSGVNGFRLIKNLPNEYVVSVVKMHRCLLHLSEIEIMPYAVLEAISHIPCIINSKAPWAHNFPIKEAVLIDPSDTTEAITTIQQVYGDPFKYPALDLDVYKVNAEKEWVKYLESEN